MDPKTETDRLRDRLAALLRQFWHAPDDYDLHRMVDDDWDHAETPAEFTLGDLRKLLALLDERDLPATAA